MRPGGARRKPAASQMRCDDSAPSRAGRGLRPLGSPDCRRAAFAASARFASRMSQPPPPALHAEGQLDHDAGRVVEKDLVQREAWHRRLLPGHAERLEPRARLLQPLRLHRDMAEGAVLGRQRIAVLQPRGDMHHGAAAAPEPDAGKVEIRPPSFLQPHHLAPEPAHRRQVRRAAADVDVINSRDGHGAILPAAACACARPCVQLRSAGLRR